jgi:predicted site-specific integrase-resolvase
MSFQVWKQLLRPYGHENLLLFPLVRCYNERINVSIMKDRSERMNVYIYTRQSTDKQENTRSAQEAECKSWAALKGYEVTAFYHDEVSGGVDPVERERFSELLDILEEGDLVIAQKRDRLGRDVV